MTVAEAIKQFEEDMLEEIKEHNEEFIKNNIGAAPCARADINISTDETDDLKNFKGDVNPCAYRNSLVGEQVIRTISVRELTKMNNGQVAALSQS